MEGERAFVQELQRLKGHKTLLQDNPRIAFKYSLGGGYKVSDGWEPLGPAGCYDTFGPELSFGAALARKLPDDIAIAKFTHSGSQILDWTPAGSAAKSRNLYPRVLAFVRDALKELADRGHEVQLAGIFYHVGENDMAYGPSRNEAAKWSQPTGETSRQDLPLPSLKWHVSQQLQKKEGKTSANLCQSVAKKKMSELSPEHRSYSCLQYLEIV